jgi:hypothetical protein
VLQIQLGNLGLIAAQIAAPLGAGGANVVRRADDLDLGRVAAGT